VKALILGGAGFIGGHLSRALAEAGAEITIVDNFARARHDEFLDRLQALPNVQVVAADVGAPGGLDGLAEDFSHIFHLAAIIGVRHVLERPYDVLTQNVALLANAITLGRRQKALRRFLFASTSEVFAGSLLHLDMPVPTPEDFPLALTGLDQPRTSYMLSKIYGEAMCHHAGLPVTIFRPHNVYGPRMGMVHVLPELMKKALDLPKGGTLDVASMDHRRAFCYIDDALAELIALAQSEDALGGTFNLGNQAAEVTIEQVARIVLQVSGRDDVTLAGRPDTAGSPSRRCPDMTRTIAVTGFTPAIDLAEGAARTFAWYRDNVFSGAGISAL